MRKYNTDPGYITIPEANRMVTRILRIADQNDKSYYKIILEAAKEGDLGGKPYKKRMYQVRQKDILQYAEKLLRQEQLYLYDIDVTPNLKEVDHIANGPVMDSATAYHIRFSLNYLRVHNIISEEAYQQGMKKLTMLLQLNKSIYKTGSQF